MINRKIIFGVLLVSGFILISNTAYSYVREYTRRCYYKNGHKVCRQSYQHDAHRRRLIPKNSYHKDRELVHYRRLPFSSEKIIHRGRYLYYHQGEFFRRNKRGYISIPPPFGAKVSKLPFGSQRHSLYGENIFEKDGVFYQKDGWHYRVIRNPFRKKSYHYGHYQRLHPKGQRYCDVR